MAVALPELAAAGAAEADVPVEELGAEDQAKVYGKYQRRVSAGEKPGRDTLRRAYEEFQGEREPAPAPSSSPSSSRPPRARGRNSSTGRAAAVGAGLGAALPRSTVPGHLRQPGGAVVRLITAGFVGAVALLLGGYITGQYFDFNFASFATKPIKPPTTPYAGLYPGQLDALHNIENPQAAAANSGAPATSNQHVGLL